MAAIMKSISRTIFIFFIALLCSQVLNFLPVDGISILRPGDQLNSTWNLVSEDGNFTLGFFTTAVTNYSYLGIWYTDYIYKTKVWVANRDTPLMINSSGVLTLDSSGTLKIMDGGRNFFAIFDLVGTRNTTAVLRDSGNFVLMDSVGNRTLWQSFDHPTDTLLPGMRLSFNGSSTNPTNLLLVSWLSDSVPASGAFAMRLESVQGSGVLVIRRRDELYWTSGAWSNGNFQFTSSWTEANTYQYNLSLTNNSDGMDFTAEAVGAPISYLQLSPWGMLFDGASRLFLSPQFCYGYESYNGCVVSELPVCRSSRDKFETKTAYFPISSSIYDDNSNISLGDCMERCWKNCTCLAFTIVSSNGTGCILWFGNEKYTLDESGKVDSIYVLVSENSSKGKSWIWIVIALAIFIVLLVSSLVGYLMRRRRRLEGEERRRREEFLSQLTTTDSFNNRNEMENNGREHHDLNIFSFGSITVATNNFSTENKLGEGGFGPVYKGKLLDGREIAVKRLSKTSGQGALEFKNELVLISKLQHTNLVRVLGCCIHQEEKMLIYEYMPNKSLDFFLFAPGGNERLDWQTRFNIIDGVAQGLLYLHKYSRMRVIHRDLKASNVLLDGNMNPKIADFGLARIFKQNEIEASTNRVVGTYGYMSPEYAMEGNFSIKSDVFSFGVLLLEIVSGRRNTSFYNMRSLNLIGHAWELWKEGNALDLKDPSRDDSCDKNKILRVIHVGFLCVQESADDRPKMEDVISMLNNETLSLPTPKQPAYFTGRNVHASTLLVDKGNQNSVQDYTITKVEAR